MKRLLFSTMYGLFALAALFVILFVTASVTYADDNAPPLTGTYVGTAVITDPVGLDPLDLAIVLTQTNGVSLTGYIDAAQSLAYPKLVVSPTVRGPAVSGSIISGTISFTLQSEVFTNTGTTVSRQVVLHTGVISDDGETLTGVYSETLWGLTPDPLVMVGRFTLIRPPHLPPAGQAVELQLGSTQGRLDPLDTISVTGRLVDFYSRAITPTVFSFTTTSGTFAPLTATTDITGDVFVDYTAGLTSGPLTVTATAMDVTGTVLMTETMNLYINEPVATSLDLDTSQDMVRVTSGQTVITATLFSQYGLPMPGETIAFSATLGAVSPTSGNTDAQGVVTTTFNAGSVAGSAAVHANVADLQETVNLQVANPYLAALRLTPAITQVTAGESLVVTTTVLDQFGEPMSDQWINFVASLGSVNPASGLSDADGHIVTTFTAGNLAGEASVQATTNNVFGEAVISVENNPPTAMALVSTAVTVYSDTTVILSGTLSTDPDNHTLSYQWEQIGGPVTATLNNEESDQANFNAPNVPGLYTFTLMVADGYGLSDSDNVTVTVENRSPSAVANSPDSIITGTVILNGDESYDPDHHILSYLWEQTSGISVPLDHAGRVTSTFTAPITPTVLTFTLTVTDDFGMSDVDITTITVHGPAPIPPVLSLDPATVSAGEVVSVPIAFLGNSYDIASTAFSVDFDESCLALGPTGNVTEAITFNLPVGFDGTATYDGGDIDGELDFIIASIASPLDALPDGVLVTVTFSTTCQPASGTIVTAPVAFSDDPAPTFGDTEGQGVAGDISDGYVEILPDGLPGDANGDGTVDAGDISALVLEIFDGDGNVPSDTPGGTFAGTPNSDANEDGVVDAGDISCVVLLIFDGPGACSGGVTTASLSTLTADLSLSTPGRVMASPNAQVVVPITYTAGEEHAISSLAFSVDYDADWLGLDATDVNGDDIPDAITFDLPPGFEAFATFDPNDVNGELDFFIIDIAPPLNPLSDGVIATITFNTGDPSVGGAEIRFSHSPAASFGDTTGKSVAGVTEGGSVVNAVTTWHYLYLPLILR